MGLTSYYYNDIDKQINNNNSVRSKGPKEKDATPLTHYCSQALRLGPLRISGVGVTFLEEICLQFRFEGG